MKKTVYLFLVFCSLTAASQNVGIGTTTPDASAILEIKSNNKGFLIPRMGTFDIFGISNPAKGLLVMDTIFNQLMMFIGPSSFDWKNIIFNSGWGLSGNSNTSTSNFIGTTDNKPLQFRINNIRVGYLEPINNNVFLGINAGMLSSSGLANIGIGRGALYSNTDRSFNIAIGDSALYNNGIGAIYNEHGSYNVAIGEKSLLANNIGWGNIAIGLRSLSNNTLGYENIAIGSLSLEKNTEGIYNTASGARALATNTTGSRNTAFGHYSLWKNTTSSDNIAIGSGSLFNNSVGYENTAVGSGSLNKNDNGVQNTAIGFQSLYYCLSSWNTAVGYQALSNNAAGYMNTGIGYLALNNNITGAFNVAIGANSGTTSSFNNTISIGNAGYPNAASNQAFLGNLSIVWTGGNTTWSTFSDARMKTNISEDVKGLDFITRLRPVTYYRNIKAATELTGNKETEDFPGKYDVEKRKESGFLAQEVEQAAKEAGYNFSGITIPQKSTELYTLSYEQFVVPLVKAVQEQQAIILSQQNKIEQLEKKIMAMEKLITK